MFKFLQQFKKNRPMRIVVNGNPALRNISEPISEITDEVKEFGRQLIRSLEEGEIPGVGLAAPQVGVNKRIIVVDTCQEDHQSRPEALPGELFLDPKMPVVLVNPEIVDSSKECESANEGCLSLPGVKGEVCRPSRVVLKAQLLDGQEFTAECGGLLARCLQHEIDHLDGILFYDRISEKEQLANNAQMLRLEKHEKSILKVTAASKN